MLHRTMEPHLSPALRLDLEDVLGNLQYARRTGNLGRLAFVTFWDARKWARYAGRDALAERASDIVSLQPLPTKAEFLEIVDDVIAELERVRVGVH